MNCSWGAHLLRPPPSLREVHFWCVFPEDVQSPALLKAYERLLRPEECRLVNEAPCHNSRKERLLARALVRTTLARYTNENISPASLGFKSNDYGKPSVVWPKIEGIDFPPLEFNISHTNSLVACGVSTSSIGIDIEDRTRVTKKDVVRLAKRWFSSKEVSWLESFTDSDEQRLHFLQLWTLKEAYVKAVGKGIYAEPLNKFTFQLNKAAPDSEAANISIELPDDAKASLQWQFLLFEPSRQHFASICVNGEQADKRSFKFWRTIPLVKDVSLVGGSALAWTENLVSAGRQLFQTE